MPESRKIQVPENNQKSQKKRQSSKYLRYIGLALGAVEIIASIVFVAMVFWINMIPNKYIIAGIIVLVIMAGIIIATQFTRGHWGGKVLAVLMSIVLVIGSIYVYEGKDALNDVSDNNTKTDVVNVYVLKDDPAKDILDAARYTFGYHDILGVDNTTNYIDKLNGQLDMELKTQTYDDFTKMVQDLYSKSVGAIVMNESYVSTLDELYPDFANETRVIASESYVTEIKKPTINKNTLTDTFTIYLSGNDECGDLNQSGRSDVNILIVVNPTTRQILLINTPRDYYVNVNSLSSKGIGKDKLTHAGIFGVDASMATLSSLYSNWDIDYYVRVNFTGVEAIVDALGGITVDSEIAFKTSPDTSDVEFTFTEGPNECNGKKALAFCRERQSVAGGDNQRGRDQMIAIQAIVDKVASPSILYNYSAVLNSVKGMFQTSLDDDDIASMVKLTMEGTQAWNVQSYAVTGAGVYGPSYFFGYSSIYMMEPNMTTVKQAVDLMTKIKNDEVFDVEEYVNDSTAQ